MPADAPPIPGPRVARAHVLAAVFVGGTVGTLVRAVLSEAIARDDPSSWPWVTFGVNVGGAFLLGLWATRLRCSPGGDPRVRPFLTTGLCGGLTTFSAVQVELVELARADAWATATAYAALTVVVGLLAVLAGRAAAGSGPG